MKILFIYPDILKDAGWPGYYYIGIGYLSAVSKQAGHQTALMHITEPPHKQQFMGTLAQHMAGADKVLIAFSSTTNMFGFATEWASWIKEKYSNLILVGGVHPTLNPEAAISTDSIDAVCIGEGEAPLIEFTDALQNEEDITGIPSIWLKNNGAIHRNPPRPWIKDLDTLPFPDRGIYDYRKLDRERENIGVFMVSRGCPYNCFYCCNHAIKECAGDSKGYVRFRSVDNVIEEIKQVLHDYPFIKFLHFDDDILPMNKKWFAEFTSKYVKDVALPFECNVRPNLLDETTVTLLREAGCQTCRLGLESGNALIRDKILNRHISEDTIKQASALCLKAGIRLYTFNMVGLPSENMAARLDTVKLNAQIRSYEEQISIFYPYEKTRLFDMCLEAGLLQNREVTNPFKDTSLSFGRVERNQIVFSAYYFPILVRIYRFYMKCPSLLSRIMIRSSDFVLCSWVTAILIYPLFNGLIRFLSRHKMLALWARKTKNAIIGKSQ
jgi:radical SAM superfamily enzyme YgiQ (UPF0313 family)